MRRRAVPIVGPVGGVAWVADPLGDGPALFFETAFGATPASAMARLNRKLTRAETRRVKRDARSLTEG